MVSKFRWEPLDFMLGLHLGRRFRCLGVCGDAGEQAKWPPTQSPQVNDGLHRWEVERI